MSRGGVAKQARRHNERVLLHASELLAAPDWRAGAALLVSAALLLAAAARTDLLVDGAGADLGIDPALCRAALGIFRARRRHADRRHAAVGNPFPRAARLFRFLPRGNVGAQPRQPDHE